MPEAGLGGLRNMPTPPEPAGRRRRPTVGFSGAEHLYYEGQRSQTSSLAATRLGVSNQAMVSAVPWKAQTALPG